MNRVFSWPVGRGRFNLPIRYAVEYAAAAAVGGLVIGLILASIAFGAVHLPRVPVVSAGALLAFIAVVFQVVGHMGFLPERRVQVPRAWLKREPAWFALRFGLVIGFGALTYVSNALAYGVVAAIAVRGDVMIALLSGVVFGLVRGLGPLVNRLFATPESAASAERILSGQGFALTSRVGLTLVGATIVFQISSALP